MAHLQCVNPGKVAVGVQHDVRHFDLGERIHEGIGEGKYMALKCTSTLAVRHGAAQSVWQSTYYFGCVLRRHSTNTDCEISVVHPKGSDGIPLKLIDHTCARIPRAKAEHGCGSLRRLTHGKQDLELRVTALPGPDDCTPGGARIWVSIPDFVGSTAGYPDPQGWHTLST